MTSSTAVRKRRIFIGCFELFLFQVDLYFEPISILLYFEHLQCKRAYLTAVIAQIRFLTRKGRHIKDIIFKAFGFISV